MVTSRLSSGISISLLPLNKTHFILENSSIRLKYLCPEFEILKFDISPFIKIFSNSGLY